MSPGRRVLGWLRVLGLALFPVVEVGLLALACLFVGSRPGWSAGFLVAGSVVHTVTIHVSVHEAIHYTDRRPLWRLFDFLLTAVGGVPFDAYRLHHHNHHRFANGLGDF